MVAWGRGTRSNNSERSGDENASNGSWDEEEGRNSPTLGLWVRRKQSRRFVREIGICFVGWLPEH
jgi:hypothetical protein